MINTYDNNVDFLKNTLTDKELEFIENLPMWSNEIDEELKKYKKMGDNLINLLHLLQTDSNYFKKNKINIILSISEVDDTLHIITHISKILASIKDRFIEFDSDLRILLLTSQLEDVTDAIKIRIKQNSEFYELEQEIIKTKSMPVLNFIRLIAIQGVDLDKLPRIGANTKTLNETNANNNEIKNPTENTQDDNVEDNNQNTDEDAKNIIEEEIQVEETNEILPNEEIIERKVNPISDSLLEDALPTIKTSESDKMESNTLRISEQKGKVFLPYSIEEVEILMAKPENEFKSQEQIISENFIVPLEIFTKNPGFSRFKEGYNLIRHKEKGSVFEAVDFGFSLMFKSNLNPAVIAACKSLEELEEYLYCLNKETLDDFNLFNIVFEVSPLKTN